MKPLDQVIRDRISPVLREAGFRRQGRSFVRQAPSGDRAFVLVRSFRLGRNDAEFFVECTVQPTAYLDWLGRHEDVTGTPIGLFNARVEAPGPHQPGLRDQWSFDLDDEQTGQELTARLRLYAAGLVRLLDRGALLALVRDPATPYHQLNLRPESATALLLSDAGPSDELDRLLTRLEAEELYAELVPWLRERAERQRVS